MGVNNLPRVVTQPRADMELNSRPLNRMFDAQPLHATTCIATCTTEILHCRHSEWYTNSKKIGLGLLVDALLPREAGWHAVGYAERIVRCRRHKTIECPSIPPSVRPSVPSIDSSSMGRPTGLLLTSGAGGSCCCHATSRLGTYWSDCKIDVTPAILSHECATLSRDKVADAATVELHAATLSHKQTRLLHHFSRFTILLHKRSSRMTKLFHI